MQTLENGHKIGEYTIQSLIKQNTYVETYRVENTAQEVFFLKLYVMKRVPTKLVNSENGTVFEIEHAQKLKHRNVISFITSGKFETEEGECQYYITEYFSGELLISRILRDGKIEPAEALEIYRGIISGLDHMHSKGLYHNDITPRNIMLSEKQKGVPEIIDLGHISPECTGKVPFDISDLDIMYSANETYVGFYNAASDIFAATSVFYTMLTGSTPWNMEFDENMKYARRVTLLKDKRKSEQPDLSGLNIDDRIRHILLRGLSTSDKERYSNTSAVLSDIDNDEVTPATPSGKSNSGSSKSQGSSSSSQKGSQSPQDDPTAISVEIKRGGGNGFKDIAGMEELKSYLSQRVLFVLQNKEKAEKYRLTTPNGMLLYGPPGCGKSFVAEKFAEESGYNFMLIKSSDLSSIYVHGPQEKIGKLFKLAETEAPIVLCFDEFDALVPDRSSDAARNTSSEVNEFLSQLNNCAQRGIFVIASTNRPDKIDPAVLRTGRIDKQVYVPLPDKEARCKMFQMYVSERPCEEKIDFEALAEATEGYIASDIAYIVNDTAMIAAYTDVLISQELLMRTINTTRPSLRKDILSKYNMIREKMEGVERKNSMPKIGF